jgi:hypothetical protein
VQVRLEVVHSTRSRSATAWPPGAIRFWQCNLLRDQTVVSLGASTSFFFLFLQALRAVRGCASVGCIHRCSACVAQSRQQNHGLWCFMRDRDLSATTCPAGLQISSTHNKPHLSSAPQKPPMRGWQALAILWIELGIDARDCSETLGAHRNLAEREGFEPSIPLRVCRISSAVRSTTPPPLQGAPVMDRGARGAEIAGPGRVSNGASAGW